MEYFFSDEANLENDYATQIEGFWHNQVQTGQFSGVDDVDIAFAYVLHPQARGSIVISSGRIEGYLKYKETLFDLYQNHFSVFVLDHRGQGLSGRMSHNPHHGLVEDFDEYVSDLKTFYDGWVKPNSQHKPFLLGHSMGSAIGTLYLLAHPEDFQAAAFSAPMYGIKSPVPAFIANGLIGIGLRLNKLLSESPWYFIGQADYMALPFALNQLTHSPVRYKIFREEYDKEPKLKLGGVTFQWLSAAIKAMDKIEQQAHRLKVPVLVLQAGADLVVDNARQDAVCALMPHCRMETFAGAKHELLMEEDKHRHAALWTILTFFDGIGSV
ncbi:alpha/beta fold hydrolase [Aliiglaciecola sp. CAU 1673]|uniref:alpha/beta fold hydrolase n=1 Tax=Aliiglaciecola sp. CAU 1673 TaxID=3032595 RepID=UPI0023DA46FD|nr:alpha/beta fold hydrolase [Aliiglaciecola sp. CAU 1673]MDF2178696.1 alpha/beta fold hydrolase [Aliiglaciecola sp. CAU 1673]